MKRAIFCLILISAGSCQMPPERMPLRILPEDSPPLPYSELLTRARLQATSATEAFYVNQWGDLEESARGIGQTARFLNKSVEVPETRKATLAADAKNLSEESAALIVAAKEKDDKKANSSLQKINFLVRKLRPEN